MGQLFFLFFSRRRDTRHRAASDTNRRARHFLRHFLRFLRVVDPGMIKLEGTFRLTLNTVPVRAHSSIASMQKLEQLILALVVGACIADA